MKNMQPTHYFSPKLVAGANPVKGGFGVYTRGAVQPGELLAVWGGRVVTFDQLEHLTQTAQHHAVQIDEDLYLAPISSPEPADFFNHSCDPNAGLRGQIALVALRFIEPGEEVCFDYAMSDGSPYDEFRCACKAATCRRVITGDDWRLPELWERYQGYFSPYLQRRIRLLQAEIAIRNNGHKCN